MQPEIEGLSQQSIDFIIDFKRECEAKTKAKWMIFDNEMLSTTNDIIEALKRWNVVEFNCFNEIIICRMEKKDIKK